MLIKLVRCELLDKAGSMTVDETAVCVEVSGVGDCGVGADVKTEETYSF